MTSNPKVYIAGPVGRKVAAQQVAEYLREAGCQIVSRWFDVVDTLLGTDEAEFDKVELDDADVILVLSDPDNNGCSTYWELGYAFAKGKPCFVIEQPQPYRCVFYYLPGIVKVADVKEFVERVEELVTA